MNNLEQRKDEKPQGWCRAQQESNGHYGCYFDCRRTFKTKREAENHAVGCQRRTICYKEMAKMAQRAGVSNLSRTSELAESAVAKISSSSSEKSNSTVLTDKMKAKETKRRFMLMLKGLPRAKMLDYV